MKFKNNKYAQYIIDDYAENEIDIDDITVKRYLIDCEGSINECDHPNASIAEFYKVLEEILGKEFLKERRVDKMFTLSLSEIFHYFVIETIEVELIKLDSLDGRFYEFYKYYSSKLNNNYKNYYNDDGSINYRGINKAYAILQQLVEFKQVINFNI